MIDQPTQDNTQVCTTYYNNYICIWDDLPCDDCTYIKWSTRLPHNKLVTTPRHPWYPIGHPCRNCISPYTFCDKCKEWDLYHTRPVKLPQHNNMRVTNDKKERDYLARHDMRETPNE